MRVLCREHKCSKDSGRNCITGAPGITGEAQPGDEPLSGCDALDEIEDRLIELDDLHVLVGNGLYDPHLRDAAARTVTVAMKTLLDEQRCKVAAVLERVEELSKTPTA